MACEVVGLIVADRAEERELVSNLRVLGKVLTNFDAGDVGLDRHEGASNIGRGVGLHVVGFQMAGTTMHKQHDDRAILDGGRGRLGLGTKELRKRESAEAEKTGPQAISARLGMRRGLKGSGENWHGLALSTSRVWPRSQCGRERPTCHEVSYRRWNGIANFFPLQTI